MRKIFLTSGLVLCMACPAFADLGPHNKIMDESQTPPVETNAGATCQQPTLEGYNGTSTFTAKWTPNVSGQIVLDSTIYSGNDHTTVKHDVATGGVSPASPTPLFSRYGVGLFNSVAGAQANDTSDLVPQVTVPSRVGYRFEGFYTTTSNDSMVIPSNGVVPSEASTVVSDPNDTDIWYAHWEPIAFKVTYTCGKVPSNASTSTPGSDIGGYAPSSLPVQTNGYYDDTFTLAPNAPDCNCLDGYHFAGWHCSMDFFTNSGQAIDYIGTPAANNPNVYTVSQSGTVLAPLSPTSGWLFTCDAIWQPNTISLTWEGAGTISGGGETCTYDGGIQLPTTVERTGYTFGGWTVSSNSPNSCNNNNGGGGSGGGSNNNQQNNETTNQ